MKQRKSTQSTADNALIKGLSEKGRAFVEDRIKFFKTLGVAVPRGIIRREAEKIS